LNANAPKPDERFSRAELRYRIADFINDRLKAIPGLHSSVKTAANWFQHRQDLRRIAAAHQTALVLRTPSASAAADCSTQPALSSDALPFPPLEMRRLVGPFDVESYDNPTGALVYPWLPAETYDKVFDFGCGCGRVARQLLLQRTSPHLYVGVDLHAGMIGWCENNLHTVAPHFSFYHHDVFNVRHNPGREKPLTAPFPVADSQFTLVNALSVFTHLTEEQAEYYLRECARILHPQGVLHASWFLFDKPDHPMMDDDSNALYVSYVDPSAAVLFDRKWVRDTARRMGLTIYHVVPPGIRGYQWLVLMTRRTDVPELELPPDTAPRGVVNPVRRNEVSTLE
jgi:SAM-dependent methyltransferase